MVEKGLLQSQQIKENPLTQNFAVGKRGRPPNISKNPVANKRAKREDQMSDVTTETRNKEKLSQNEALKEAML